MAELQFEAPLANFDGEEWNEFHDFQSVGDIENCNADSATKRHTEMLLNDRHSSDDSNSSDGGPAESHCGAETFNETFSGSLEDLVNNFDEKVTKCFRNFDEHVEEIAPVQMRTADEITNDCQTWWTLTGQYGNLLPINWTKNFKIQNDIKSPVTPSRPDLVYSDFDLYNDDDMDKEEEELYFTNDELNEPLSFHDPVVSAEEVISEIEAMMEDTTGPEKTSSESDMTSNSSERSSPDGMQRSTMWFEDSLKRLSTSALCQLYDELDCAVKEYTEILFQELNLNDELKYEKELNNDFICLMISVQNKQRESKLEIDNMTKRQPTDGTYLTTVIPYQSSEGHPTMQQLQVFIKILLAIDQDSPSVPGLLTDYILKVLCPTT